MRHFLRCNDCLSVMAVDLAPDAFKHGAILCECGGKTSLMGIVRGKRVAKPELACPCDDRCTNAPGPSCDCRCQGVNHGSKKLVEVWKDAVGIPRVKPVDPAAIQRAEEFRAAKASAKARLMARHGSVLDAIRAGRHGIDETAYWAARRAEDCYHEAKAFKTHKRRMEAMASVCA